MQSQLTSYQLHQPSIFGEAIYSPLSIWKAGMLPFDCFLRRGKARSCDDLKRKNLSTKLKLNDITTGPLVEVFAYIIKMFLLYYHSYKL